MHSKKMSYDYECHREGRRAEHSKLKQRNESTLRKKKINIGINNLKKKEILNVKKAPQEEKKVRLVSVNRAVPTMTESVETLFQNEECPPGY